MECHMCFTVLVVSLAPLVLITLLQAAVNCSVVNLLIFPACG